jgi:alpha-L-arabinofuranosidase
MRAAFALVLVALLTGCTDSGSAREAGDVPAVAPQTEPSFPAESMPIAEPAPVESAAAPSIPVVYVNTDVLRKSPRRLGVNIGKTIYYTDNDVMAMPLVHGHFRKGRQVRVMQADGRADTVILDVLGGHANPGADAPTLTGGTYYIATGARAGESGRILKYNASAGSIVPEHDGAPLGEGDVVLLQGPWTSHATPIREEGDPKIGIGDFRPRTAQDATLELVTTGDDGEGRDQAVRVTFSGSRQSRGGVAHYVLLHPGDEYEVTVRAKGTAGSELRVSIGHTKIPRDDPAAAVTLTAGQDNTLLPEWQDYVFRGRASGDSRVGEGASRLEVWLVDTAGRGGGAQLDAVTLTNTTTVTAPGVHREVLAALQDGRCGVLRYLGAAGMGSMVDDLMAASPAEATWAFVAGKQFYEGHETYMVADQMIHLAEMVGAVPWLVVGAANTPADWHRLISYLAAPAGYDEWADLRVAHGFEAPWTERVDSILLEAGNEWWNPAFKPLYIDSPDTFAEFISHLYAAVRAHPHFDSEKIELVAGGWAANGKNWTTVLAEQAEGTDVIAIAPYVLHQLANATSDEQLFGALFAEHEAYFRGPGAQFYGAAVDNAREMAVYEINTHLAGGVSRDVSTRLAASAAAGVAVLDKAMGALATLGADPIAYYQLFQRHYDQRYGLWGAIVRDPDASLRPRPVWLGLELANRFLIEGDMTAAGVRGSPVWRQAANGPIPAMAEVPYLHAYAFTYEEGGATRANVLVVNRHRTNPLDVTFELPFAAAGDVRKAWLTADSLHANNEETEQVSIREETITGFDPTVASAIPPFSAVVFRFREAAL